MFKWFKSNIEKYKTDFEYFCWDIEAERLMNLCRDTGGENSPYFEKLKEHMNNCPTDEFHYEPR